MGRHVPSAHLNGFDVSPSQYPPKEWLPSHTSLQVLDIHKDLPDELKGKYDLVHIRLFLTVVRNDNPLPILQRAMDMLSKSSFNPVVPGREINWVFKLIFRVPRTGRLPSMV